MISSVESGSCKIHQRPGKSWKPSQLQTPTDQNNVSRKTIEGIYHAKKQQRKKIHPLEDKRSQARIRSMTSHQFKERLVSRPAMPDKPHLLLDLWVLPPALAPFVLVLYLHNIPTDDPRTDQLDHSHVIRDDFSLKDNIIVASPNHPKHCCNSYQNQFFIRLWKALNPSTKTNSQVNKSRLWAKAHFIRLQTGLATKHWKNK